MASANVVKEDNQNVHDTESTDNFKSSFKKYKRRDEALDLSDVIDLDKHGESSSYHKNSISCVRPVIPSLPAIIGLKPVQDWQIVHFVRHKGFYLIRNPFLPGYQRYWISRCLQDLPLPPNVTNLRVHPDIDPCTVWSTFVSQHFAGKAFNNSSPLWKLRWTTIGYHYNWDTKEYREEEHTPFPDDVGLLAHYIAQVVGFRDFKAEAGIVNYYHLDSTLAAHTDHSELDHQAPLISISFGQDAIFLMGGETKATTPTAVMLHSGDICVMSGAARLAYHAVPRILPSASLLSSDCFDFPTDITADGENQEKTTLCTHKDIQVGDEKDGLCGCEGSQNRLDRTDDIDTRQSNQTQVDRTVSKSAATDISSQPPHSVHDQHDPSDKNEQQFSCDAADSSSHLSQSNHNSQSPSCKSISCEECDENLVRKVNSRIVQTLRRQEWGPFTAYLNSSRLNVNIRQVLKPGHTFPRPRQQENEDTKCKRPRTEITL